MAPNQSIGPDYLWLDNHRSSPRIFKKKSSRLDTSSVNNKVDFMRSLNLLCTMATESFERNLESVPSKKSVKKCAVILKKSFVCDDCGQLLNCKSDVEIHKNLHQCFSEGSVENNNNLAQNSNSNFDCDNSVCKDFVKSSRKNNISNSADNLKSIKKHRRRSKDAVTKVTFKIGGEVISKKYCKNKYLDKTSSEHKKINQTDLNENRDECVVKDKVDEFTTKTALVPTVNQPEEVQSGRNIDRLREMAALLVEQELQRIAREKSILEISSDEESDVECEMSDEAVVPQSNGSFTPENVMEISMLPDHNESDTSIRKKSKNSENHYEVITIDDDDDEDAEILRSKNNTLETRLGMEHDSLKEPEISYNFNISSQDSENTLLPEKLDACKTQKKNFQETTIKYNFGLPLRLRNF